MESNRKSVLSKNSITTSLDSKDLSKSFHVTFAKANQSALSSKASMIPALPFPQPFEPVKAKPKSPVQGKNDKIEIKHNTGEASDQSGTSEEKPQKQGPSGQPNRRRAVKSAPVRKTVNSKVITHTKTRQTKPAVAPEVATDLELVRKDEKHRPSSTRSSKEMKKHTKSANDLPRASPRRSKSRKSLHHKRASLAKAEKIKSETIETSQSKVDPEYVAELNKITRILNAVNAVEAKESPTLIANVGAGVSKKKSVNRPLSTGELKQLLSSITRVVSLHELPVDKEDSDTKTPVVASTSPPKQKKTSLHKRSMSQFLREQSQKESRVHFPNRISRRDERLRSNSRFSSKSKESVKRGRSRKKVSKSKEKRRSSDHSSNSSIEKDPVKHAAFLNAYFEESTRLAETRSSQDVVAPSKPPPKKESTSVKKTSRKKIITKPRSKSNRSLSHGHKTTVTASVAKSQRSKSLLSHTASSQSKSTVSGDGAKTGLIKPTKSSKSQKQTTEIPQPKLQGIKPNKEKSVNIILNEKSSLSNFSTTAIAGSPKPLSPVVQSNDKTTDAPNQGERVLGIGRTRIVDPTNNKAVRQQQIKHIEEVINSKFKGDTGKMRAIWEQAPNLPMTLGHFRWSFSEYGSETDSGIKQLNGKVGMGSVTKAAVKEKTREKIGRTYPSLSLPNSRPISEASRIYNQLNFDRANMRKEARQIRTRFRDDALRSLLSRPLTVTRRDAYLGGVGANVNSVNDAFKYFRGLIRRDTNSH